MYVHFENISNFYQLKIFKAVLENPLLRMDGANNQVYYNDLSVVVIQLLELKNFLEYLEMERQLGEFLEEKREELIDNLNSMEYLLKIVYLFTDVEVQVEDVPEVHDNTEAGLTIMRHFLDCLEIEGRLDEFLEEFINSRKEFY